MSSGLFSPLILWCGAVWASRKSNARPCSWGFPYVSALGVAKGVTQGSGLSGRAEEGEWAKEAQHSLVNLLGRRRCVAHWLDLLA